MPTTGTGELFLVDTSALARVCTEGFRVLPVDGQIADRAREVQRVVAGRGYHRAAPTGAVPVAAVESSWVHGPAARTWTGETRRDDGDPWAVPGSSRPTCTLTNLTNTGAASMIERCRPR